MRAPAYTEPVPCRGSIPDELTCRHSEYEHGPMGLPCFVIGCSCQHYDRMTLPDALQLAGDRLTRLELVGHPDPMTAARVSWPLVDDLAAAVRLLMTLYGRPS